jgi:excisionase family DNA binding protein
MTNKFPTPPAPIMTPDEIEAAEEAFIQGEQDFLDHQQEAKKQPTRVIEPHTLRTKEAAEYAGVSEWKLRQLVHSGEMTFLPGKYWRFATSDLDKWIERGREKRTL